LNLNIYRNTHERTLNDMKVKFDQIMQPRLSHLPQMDRVVLVFTLFTGTRQLCDTANICCIVDKFFSDSLVHAGKIEDDNYNVVLSSTYRYGGYDKSDPRVEVTIEPVGSTLLKYPTAKTAKEHDPMKIIITQAEIEEAIRDRILKQITVKDDMEITVDLSATRGDTGFTAAIDIIPKGTTAAAPAAKAAPVAAQAAQPAEPIKEPAVTPVTTPTMAAASATGEAPKRRGRPSKAEVAAREAAAAAATAQEAEPAVEEAAEEAPVAETAEEPVAAVEESVEAEATATEPLAIDIGKQEEKPVEEAVKEEAPVAAAPKKSIFGNLSRPVNEPTE
jgi:hypothetical protein